MSAARVLIVDDNAVLAELASFVLRAARFTVASETDATRAAATVAAFRPQLILMDMQMPDIDGLVLTAQLKADPATRHIVVIAFTAFAMKGDEDRLRRAGCDGYIAKPFDVAALVATVRACLRAAPLPAPPAPTHAQA